MGSFPWYFEFIEGLVSELSEEDQTILLQELKKNNLSTPDSEEYEIRKNIHQLKDYLTYWPIGLFGEEKDKEYIETSKTKVEQSLHYFNLS